MGADSIRCETSTVRVFTDVKYSEYCPGVMGAEGHVGAGNSGLLAFYRSCESMFCSPERVWERTPCDVRISSSVSPFKSAKRRGCEPRG